MVVALLVIGPERLPLVAKKAGLWAGKASRMIRSVKADIDLELKAQDLKNNLSMPAGPHEFSDVEEEIRRLGELAKSSHLRDAGGQTKRRENKLSAHDPALNHGGDQPLPSSQDAP